MIARLLALALLLAQIGAEVHAYSHVTDPAGTPSSIDSCARCLGSSPLSAAVGSPPLVIYLLPCTDERIVVARAAPVPHLDVFPAFQARAPPTLL